MPLSDLQLHHYREFLELDAELPKASQTSTLSGKSVLKAITKLGDKVSQYATKMEETDSWFEDKTNIIENLDIQLRKLLLATDAMVEFRFEIFLPRLSAADSSVSSGKVCPARLTSSARASGF